MDAVTARKDLYRLAERLNVANKEEREAIESAAQIFAYGFKTGIDFAKFNPKPQEQEMKENAAIPSV